MALTGNDRQPTADSIAIEALRQSGISYPGNEEKARAIQEWIPAVINDLWNRAGVNGNRRLKTLQRDAVIALNKGQRKYDFPDDFDEETSVTLFCPQGTVEVSENSANDDATVKFTTADSSLLATAGNVIGRYVAIFGIPNGDIRQWREVISSEVSGSDTVLTVDEEWDENLYPEVGETIVSYSRGFDLHETGVREQDDYLYRPGISRPSSFAKYRDQMMLNSAPHEDYWAIRLRYFCNPHKLPDGDQILLDIYRDWYDALVLGTVKIGARSYGDLELLRLIAQDYEAAAENLLRSQIPYGGQDVRFSMDDRGLDRGDY